ncbi:MAG: hypothetical protein J7578_09085 [Chitinophagaceae bacterium]|nr:hypothetical protein [Chitinophagaceae bacterium]
MGLFNLFRKRPVFQDEFFGALKFFSNKNTNGFFSGTIHFPPVKKEIELLIRAEIDGPTEKHREFYHQFQQNYLMYIEKAQQLIEEEFRNWKEDFAIVDFNTEFSLIHLEIPNPEVRPLTWDISFSSIHDLNHYFTISFAGEEATSIVIDG